MAAGTLKAFQYDFSSPYISVAIVSPVEGKSTNPVRTPLWTDLQLNDADRARIRLGKSSFPYVSSLSVEIGLGAVPKIVCMLTPPFRDAQAFLDSELMEWGFTRLEAQFGYTGGAPGGVVLSPVFSGMILKPDLSFGGDQTITLSAIGDGGWAATQTSNMSTKGPATRKELIQELVKGPDGTRRFEVDFKEAELDYNCNLLLNTDPVRLVCSGQTEWFLINQLVRAARCYLIVHGATLYILPRSLKGQTPGRVFRYFDHKGGMFSPATQDFPILTYNSPTMAVFLNSSAKTLVLRDVDSLTKEDSQTILGDELGELYYTDQRGTIEPPVSPDTPGSASQEGAPFPVGSPNDTTTFNQAVSELDGNKTMMGVNLTVGSLGIPDLQPGEVVTATGMFRHLNTNYAILTVKHTLDSSGYATEWTGISNVNQIGTYLPAEFQGPAAPLDRSAVNGFRREREAGVLNDLDDRLSEEVFPTSPEEIFGPAQDTLMTEFTDSLFGPDAKIPKQPSVLDKGTQAALRAITRK